MKLPTLLKSLHSDEQKDFEKFLQSPFFKASEQYLKFFKYLCKHHRGFDLGKPEMETAYRRCFGKEAYTEVKLYSLMSGLARQVEQYLAVKMVVGDDGAHLQDALLVRALGKRKMGDYYRAAAQQFADEVEAQPVKGKDDYLLLEQLHTDFYFNPDTAKHRPQPTHLHKGMEQLDLFYSVAKLRYAAELMARERAFNEPFELPMLDFVVQYANENISLEQHPLPVMYNKLVQLYSLGVPESGFREYYALFLKKHNLLPKTDQVCILAHLINCGISLGRADLDVNQELLALYKMAIDTEIIMDEGRITHLSYSNIVSLAVVCGEFDWAGEFMEGYAPYLADNMRTPTMQLCMAHIHHAKGELDKAQSCLVQEVFMMPSFDIIGRGLLLKILFERYIKEGKDYEFLTGHLNAFEKFMEIKHLSDERKAASINAIRFVRKMTKAKLNYLKVPIQEKSKFRENLKKLSPIVMKKWLLDKIEEL
jgi:hypothetical protein